MQDPTRIVNRNTTAITNPDIDMQTSSPWSRSATFEKKRAHTVNMCDQFIDILSMLRHCRATALVLAIYSSEIL